MKRPGLCKHLTQVSSKPIPKIILHSLFHEFSLASWAALRDPARGFQSDGGEQVAISTAFVVGYFSLKLLHRLLKENKFFLFSYYCWTVGAVILSLELAKILSGKV